MNTFFRHCSPEHRTDSRPAATTRGVVSALCTAAVTALVLIAPGTPAGAAPTKRPHMAAELITETETIRPGHSFEVGLRLAADDGWHTYWRNPGDSGLPTRIEWTLPEGFVAGPIRWPLPARFETEGIVTYGYDEEVLLLSHVTAPQNLAPGQEVELRATASWLVCRADACIPGRAEMTVVVSSEDHAPLPDTRWSDQFAETRKRIPSQLEGWSARARSDGKLLELELTPPEGSDPSVSSIEIFPLERYTIDARKAVMLAHKGESTTLHVPVSNDRKEPLDQISLVLLADNAWDYEGQVRAVEVTVPVEATVLVEGTKLAGTASAVTASGDASANSEDAAAAQKESRQGDADESVGENAAAGTADAPLAGITFGIAVASAFLGGLLLNLMPCVFPVLSLKILGFVQVGGGDNATIRKHGWLFAAGVLVSFQILAGLLLLLRAGGGELGWGFQLQSPAFVAAVSMLLFTMALNLLGVFEIGNSLTAVGGRWESAYSGYLGSFNSGVLATILATPCSAPFMGTALGFAIAQPATTALAVFSSLGAGMAAPYVLLSHSPTLVRLLPKPGAWMETFKRLMALPLLATVAWLVWVFAQQVGSNGVRLLLGALLLFCIGLSTAGSRQRGGSGTRAWTNALVAGSVGGGLAVAVAAAQLVPVATGETGDAGGWVAYEPAALEQYRSEGRSVFLDFTAAWCLSCQVNERVVLDSEDVVRTFEELGVVRMKADWTDGDPEVTRALESFGRNAVPLYVLYPGSREAQPQVLSEIITRQSVIAALKGLDS